MKFTLIISIVSILFGQIGSAQAGVAITNISCQRKVANCAVSLTTKSDAGNDQQNVIPPLSSQDATLIAEAYHLWQSLGEKLWPGWTTITTPPFIYVTSEYEYAIGFPKPLQGFTQLEANAEPNGQIQARKRVFSTHVAASFPYEGIPTIVIGTPKALEKSPAQWTLTVSHEMFHVLEMMRGSMEKIAQLKIGSESDPSWQLQFPFPYKDADVMRLIHLQAYPLYLAATAGDESDVKYNATTAVDAIRVYRDFLKNQSPDNKPYNYAQFQEWNEGIAFYTEYKMAEAAASSNYHPIAAFTKLPDYQSYQQAWDTDYKNRIFLVKHAGRAAQSRTAFYHLGLGKGLLLDKLMPDWKTRYFAPTVWLDDLVMESIGQPTEIPILTAGAVAPDFNLTSTTGASVSLNKYRGKVVLIDFWQTWCPPCLEALPHLQSLQAKYAAKGLVVLGITGKLDSQGADLVGKLVREKRIEYPTLVDEKAAIAGLYNVSGFPHVFIIDRSGHLTYDKAGYQGGAEAELEREIEKALASSAM